MHIKKTAGISIRESLEESEAVVCDYGAGGPKTSPVIKQYKYDSQDPYRVRQYVRAKRAWMVGHFPLLEYADLVDCRRIFTFVREPVRRMVSHFNHAKLYINPDWELEPFLLQKTHRNEQARKLGSLPLGCIGCVGVTEKIGESLQLINAQLGTRLQTRHANINPLKALPTDELSDDIRELIRENNRKDIALYQRALALHEQRFDHFSRGLPWCHGYYRLGEEGRLSGIAYFADSDESVELQVQRNGVTQQSLVANRFYNQHVKFRFPRERYVAFETTLPDGDGDAEIVVAQTGQTLLRD
ncbi:MAG: hypothetical protein CME59_19945 [Halioglobus sp.]|nr:hypothetical protein [Halioglobus sp.]